MCLLFETIKVEDGVVRNLSYHQMRVAKYSTVNLLEYISNNVAIPVLGVHKLRITYSIYSVCSYKLELYNPKKIESLKIIIDNEIDYHKKLDDRTCLNDLIEQRGECDDILIIKNNFVSDTSFANIIFFDGEKWITPNTPLLEGSCRSRLIRDNIIRPQSITSSDLKSYSSFMIINAMLDFDLTRVVNYKFIDGCLKLSSLYFD